MILRFVKAIMVVFRAGPGGIEKLIKDSVTDSLTGLLNKRGFDEFLEIEKSRSDRYGHCFSIIYIDMDNLKKINDFQGHDVGNKALISLAETIKSNCRNTDFAARVGGDEFIIVLPETDEQNAGTIIERIRNEAGNISAGCSEYCGITSADGIIRMAETRMREEKRKKKA